MIIVRNYLDVSKRYAFLISILLDSHKEVLIVRVLATTCVIIASPIVCPISMMSDIYNIY